MGTSSNSAPSVQQMKMTPPPAEEYLDSGLHETLVKKEFKAKDQAVFTLVEVMPEFPGGETALNKFMKDNLHYPKKAMESGITGKVIVSFLVDENGNIRNVKVLKGIGGGCDEEAIRLIKMMPAWKPGKMGGKPVKVSMSLPVKFSLR